jgi:hypothetical protein
MRALVLALVTTGCSSILGFDPPKHLVASDAGFADGPVADGNAMQADAPPRGDARPGPDAAPIDAGIDADTCPTLYVAPPASGGNDLNTGCTQSDPLATLGGANYALGVRGPHEVHVCAGSYAGTTFNNPGKLMGGYSCSSWSRTTAYGYPTFDGVNETIVTNPGGGLTGTMILGGSIDAASVFDGFTVQALSSGTSGSQALVVQESAGPTISNDKILGGATSSSTESGSMGLRLASTGAPIVTLDVIDGGTGSSSVVFPASGSVGLLIEAGTPRVGMVTIHGGGGSSSKSIASVGVTITGGDLTTTDGGGIHRRR